MLNQLEQIYPAYFSKMLENHADAAPIHRFNFYGNRFYLDFIEPEEGEEGETEIIGGISATTVGKLSVPEEIFLTKWRENYPGGPEAARAYTLDSADKGTIIHALMDRFVKTGSMDNKLLVAEAISVGIDKGRSEEWVVQRLDEIQKKTLSFVQFMTDFEVEPLAAEIPVLESITIDDEEYWVGALLDLPCTMKKTRASKTRINALVDWKTGKSITSTKNELQLRLNKMAWEIAFPEIQIESLINVRPKDWLSTPTYEAKDWSKNGFVKYGEEAAKQALRWAWFQLGETLDTMLDREVLQMEKEFSFEVGGEPTGYSKKTFREIILTQKSGFENEKSQ